MYPHIRYNYSDKGCEYYLLPRSLHMHACTYPHAQTHRHICTDAYTNTDIHMCARACAHAHTHTYTHTHAHIHIHTHTTHTHTHIHAQTHNIKILDDHYLASTSSNTDHKQEDTYMYSIKEICCVMIIY